MVVAQPNLKLLTTVFVLLRPLCVIFPTEGLVVQCSVLKVLFLLLHDIGVFHNTFDLCHESITDTHYTYQQLRITSIQAHILSFRISESFR
jgi:hypothetical protein